jgi:hypothetical protein
MVDHQQIIDSPEDYLRPGSKSIALCVTVFLVAAAVILLIGS